MVWNLALFFLLLRRDGQGYGAIDSSVKAGWTNGRTDGDPANSCFFRGNPSVFGRNRKPEQSEIKCRIYEKAKEKLKKKKKTLVFIKARARLPSAVFCCRRLTPTCRWLCDRGWHRFRGAARSVRSLARPG